MAWLENRWRSEWGLSLGVLVVGITISAAGAYRLAHEINERAHVDFDRSANRVREAIQLRFGRTIYGLNGAKGMYAANDSINRAQFRAYVESRNLQREFPGVRGFGLIQRVRRTELEAFVATEQADGAPGFAIRQLVDKNLEDLLVIRFIDPGAQNAGALGLDIGSESVRRRGAEKAIATGEATLSGNIVLVQDNKRSAGALLYVPLYRNGPRPTTPSERNASLLGLLYAPIVLSELLDGIHDVEVGRLEFDLFDSANLSESVYASRDGGDGTPTRPAIEAPRFHASAALAVSGRDMTLQLRSTPAFDAEINQWPSWLLLMGGTLVSALLSLLVWQQASGRRRAETLARGMTQDLDRLAQVVRHTSNAVSIHDRDQRITWINEGFTRITGYGASDALGKRPGDLLSSGKAPASVLQTLAESARTGTGCRVEILNRAKDGREFWIDTEVQPLRDAQGTLTGFMEIGNDITERRQARLQLQAVVRDNQALLNTLDMHAIVSVADRAGNITEVNDAFCAISGYRRDELLGQNHRIINSGVHDALFWQDMWDTIASGTPWRAEVCNRAKNGALYWVHTFIAPFRGADGEIEKYISMRIDITASKVAEQDLARERSTLANIIDGTNAGTWEWNAATGQTRVNARWAQIAGYRLDERDFTRIETWTDLIHPDDRRRSHRLMLQHFRGETAGYECENRMRHKDGHWVWVLGRGRLLERSADGKPTWVAGIHLDISQRKLAEVALRENENLMRLVIDNMGGRLAYFDRHTRLQLANQATYDFFGGTPSSRIGCSFADLLGPARMSRMGLAVERVLAGELQSYESEASEPDGQKTYSVVHLVPDLRDGQVHGFVALAVDVTLAKRAEVEVRRADRLMRLAIEAIDAAVVLYGPDDRLVFCNDKYRELYGASADLIVPGVAFEDLIREGVRRGQYSQAVGQEEEWIAKRLADHRRDHSELVQVTGDGRSLRVVERRMPDGHTVGFRIDITEQVEAAKAAQAGSRAKSQFLANMSHEIRTPMNAILGLLTLLRKTRLDGRQADYALKTEKAARSLLGLLNDILDISKVESGKLALDMQPFEIDLLLRDLAVILAANLGDKPVEVLFDIDPDLPALVEGDMLRLQQVLINLGGNAIKFTEQGEVVVSVRLRKRDAHVAAIDFAVRDSGIGVAPEHHDHIFSGFSQAEASTTRRFGGTGLGLAISSRLVEMMGGRLEIDSALGKGSRFHFSITLAVPAQAADEPKLAPEKLRVLVVDDNDTARELLKELSASLGWTVEVASGGGQALEMIAQGLQTGRPWQVVLMDWRMPGMDGWQACQRIRSMEGAQATLVLMVTAHGREALAQHGLQSPETFDGFLIKPVTGSMLHDAVQQIRTGHSGEVYPPKPEGASRRLDGMRLLVAEDNATNQMVVRELLEDEGAIVDIVSDGAAAVRAVVEARGRIDAVLMDLQMPVMDGLTATGLIRSDLGQAHLPIIAMTANAMASDRDACLAAGMNDHVGKPFEIDHLVNVLRKHGGRPQTGHDTDGPQRPGEQAIATAARHAAARAGIDVDAAVRRLSGNLRLYRQLVRGVSSDLSSAPDRLRQAAASGDAYGVAMALHALRGPVAAMGADHLASVLADGEKKLDTPVAADALVQIIETVLSTIDAGAPGLRALVVSLDQALPERVQDAANSASAEQLQALLQQLALQLRDSDMAATDTIADMRQRLATELLVQLQPLEDAVDALEFDTALRLCNDWLEIHTA